MADQEIVRQLIEKVKEQQEAGAKFQAVSKEVDELKTAIAQEEINALEEITPAEVVPE